MATTPLPQVEGMWDSVQPEASRKLLFAALEAFSARGYHATTTREIAQRVGMSPAAVYVHYATKVDLLYTIGRTGHEMVLADVEQALEGVEDPVEGVRRFMEAFTRWHARYHTLARVIQYELHNLPAPRFAEIRNLRRRFDVILRSLIGAGIDQEVLTVEDVDIAVVALLSLGIDVARWYTPRHGTPEVLGAHYADIASRIIGA